jgi:response regulator NasT
MEISARSAAASSLRVLIVEDDALVSADMAGVLREIGHTVAGTATDGDMAMRVVAGGEVDLALMDIRLPGRSGLVVARELLERHRVPSVIVTAYSDREVVAEAMEGGAIGFVVKPAGPDQLRVAVDMAKAQVDRARQELDREADLRRKLEERRLAERAKWVIVDKYGVSEPDAWAMLQKACRATRMKLPEMAAKVVETKEVPVTPSVKRRLSSARRGKA